VVAEVTKPFIAWALFAAFATQTVSAQQPPTQKELILWQKLEATIQDEDRKLDGVLGVAILDFSTGRTFFLNADEVLPTASSIKIAILAELYHQAQQGKLKLTGVALPGAKNVPSTWYKTHTP